MLSAPQDLAEISQERLRIEGDLRYAEIGDQGRSGIWTNKKGSLSKTSGPIFLSSWLKMLNGSAIPLRNRKHF